MSEQEKSRGSVENGSRLIEITRILTRHEVVRGMTPEKLRLILEDLGPTYIKLGQIMSTRSDILPQAYCDELMKLRSEVPPMPFEEVIEVIETSYKQPWGEVFQSIEKDCLGSASIAQVHRAKLVTGEDVVIKVQRKGIYDVMKRDIGLMHKAVRLMPTRRLSGVVDLDMILDELWVVTQEEMNFMKEADSMEEFARFNREVEYFATPVLYRGYTTGRVLVMEYIDGIEIDDKERLLAEGYDLNDIGTKFVDNYIHQVLDDGFFHADPHPGNLRIRDGKIVWIDMGMMGHMSEHDRTLLRQAVEGIATNDIGEIQDAVMALGKFRGKPDPTRLYEDLAMFMAQYGKMEMKEIDIARILTELMEIMKKNRMSMPHGFTLLVRGLTQVEGVLAEISPEISVVEIAAARFRSEMYSFENWQAELKSNLLGSYRSAKDLVSLPTLTAKILRGYQKGQTRINLDLHSSDELSALLRHLVRNMVIGLCLAALLISSSIICLTDMWPKVFGIPLLGAAGYFIAIIISVWLVLRYFRNRRS